MSGGKIKYYTLNTYFIFSITVARGQSRL